MYGRKASQLLKEFVSGEPGQLTGFNNDLFAQVIEECDGNILHLQALLRKMQEEGSNNQTNKNADHFGALVHHLSLVRNKRCLMAYVYNRAEVIQNLGWTIKHADLPAAVKEKLSISENEYFGKHSSNLQSYMLDLNLDLAIDMVPPKDPYIKVRVLEEIGEVLLSDQIANLAMHSILFLKRVDAESFISQGKMEELTS
ncbi:putative GINS complex, subunit Psf1, GINS subunit, domain A protein [Helianthus debilis subsp. tardiflorus]